MPELPEVETISRVLKHNLLGKRVSNMKLNYEPLLEAQSPYTLIDLNGAKFTEFKRRGKYLIFGFDNKMYWVVHLRMEGKFHLYQEDTPITKHTHLTFTAEDTFVHYLDTRKFSRMSVVKDLETYLETKKLGYEPFDEDLTPEYLKESFKNKTQGIKASLLDQRYITGIGNIYADEILFASKIHPLTPAQKLSKKELQTIIDQTRIILDNAIEAGGTTIRSYTSSLGVSGRFQISLNAYGQAGQPCVVCNTPMERIKVLGRSTVFCKKCQKVKR